MADGGSSSSSSVSCGLLLLSSLCDALRTRHPACRCASWHTRVLHTDALPPIFHPPHTNPAHIQDRQVINAIATYFSHPIPEVPHDDEDAFISVLNKAGLTDQTA